MVRTSYPGKPLPIGYIEKQVGWVGDYGPEGERKIINAAVEAAARELTGHYAYSERIERTVDGGGVKHSTAYLGFAPIHVAAEPLNNRNLNNAPLPQPDAVPGASQQDDLLPLGHRERKF